MKSKINNFLYVFAGIVILCLLSIPLMYYIKSTNIINGADIYGHLYKTDLLYKNIQNGNFFTLYDEQWYNGIQMFRYWPPLSYYFLALLQFFAGGNIESAYILLAGTTFIISGIPWLLFGKTENKKILGIVMSILYWFLPDNIRIFFSEGNLPRIVFVALLPYLFYFVWKFIKYEKNIYIIHIILISIIFIFIHLMMSAIVGIGTTLFLFLYFINTKKFKRPFIAMLGIICSYISGGVVLLPGLLGGIVNQNSSASISTIGDWSQELYKSLNPFLRFNTPGLYYFGISIFLIILFLLRFAIVNNNKEIVAPLVSALIIMFLTSSSLTPYISLLPMSQVWWMVRFTTIAVVCFVMSLFLIKNTKHQTIKYIAIILILVLDLIPSLKLIGLPSDIPLAQIQEQYDEEHLYNEAQNITSNRLMILDESAFGSYESYFIKNKKINITTGWALQGAQTYENIVYLNEAIMSNAYSYLFDRTINLGADTIIIKKSALDISELKKLKETATKYNFELIDENSTCLLFKLKDVDYKFNVVNEYKNIAIGSSSRYISLIYPDFENTSDNYIDDYTLEELLKYKKIYLSGNFYKNKKQAEFLVKQLSQNNVKVFIDINGIEEDFQGYKTFLDVSCRTLTLLNSFPNLSYNNKDYLINYDMNENWNASYITNIENDENYFTYAGQKYCYLRQDENITYIGMNLIYFYNQYQNDNLKLILNKIFDENEKDFIITKKIVKSNIDIDYDKNTITILSDNDNLNTTLAYQDFFTSSDKFYNKDNLLVVNKGKTVLHFEYKYLKEGILLSCFGVVLSMILVIFTFYKRKEDNE